MRKSICRNAYSRQCNKVQEQQVMDIELQTVESSKIVYGAECFEQLQKDRIELTQQGEPLRNLKIRQCFCKLRLEDKIIGFCEELSYRQEGRAGC